MYKLKVSEDYELIVEELEKKKEISLHTNNEILFYNFELEFTEKADNNQESNLVEEFLETSKEKPFLVLNNENEEVGEFLVERYNRSLRNSSYDDYATDTFSYYIETKQYEEIKVENLIINNNKYEVLRYSEKIAKNDSIVINVILKLSENEKENILDLKYDDEVYFDVQSIGLRESSLRMRFGAIFWSIHDGFYKAGVTLVEDKYDEISLSTANLYMVNINNLIKEASEQMTYLKLLESLLIDKGLASEEEIKDLQEQVKKESYQSRWKFTLVKDVEELN